MEKLDNQLIILQELHRLDLNLGCYDKKINVLNDRWIKEVIKNIKFQSDTIVCISRKKYVVEIDIVDNEVDFNLLSKAEYIDRYGSEFFEE